MAKTKFKSIKKSEPKQADPLVHFGENYTSACLLDTIVTACSTDEGTTISSKNIRAYARSIQDLDLWGLVTITTQEADNIVAGITLKGVAYRAQLLKDDEEYLADQNSYKSLPELSYR